MTLFPRCRIRGSTPRCLPLVASCLCFVLVAGTTVSTPLFAQTEPVSESAALDRPNPDQALRQMVRDYLAAGDYDTAISCLTQLLAKDPADRLSLRADLGLCHKAKRDYTKAVPILEEVAATSNERQVEALFWIEDAYCEQGKYAQAIEHLTNMYANHPELRSQILGRRADRLNTIGRSAEALADYQEFLAAYPQDDLAKIFKLEFAKLTYKLKGDGPEFAAALQQAAEAASSPVADPGQAKSLAYELGYLYKNTEHWDKAIAYFKTLMMDYPADAQAHRANLALCYKGKRDYTNAVQILKEMFGTVEGEQRKQISFWILDCMTEQRQLTEALDYLDRFLAELPECKGEVIYRRAVCRGQLGQHQESIKDLDEYVKLFPDAPFTQNVKLMIAQTTMHGLRDYSTGRALIQKFIEDYPQYPEMIVAKQELAFCSYYEQKFADAALLFEDAAKAAELGNTRAYVTYMAGLSHKAAGNTLGMQTALEQLVELYPDDPWTKQSAEDYSTPSYNPAVPVIVDLDSKGGSQ